MSVCSVLRGAQKPASHWPKPFFSSPCPPIQSNRGSWACLLLTSFTPPPFFHFLQPLFLSPFPGSPFLFLQTFCQLRGLSPSFQFAKQTKRQLHPPFRPNPKRTFLHQQTQTQWASLSSNESRPSSRYSASSSATLAAATVARRLFPTPSTLTASTSTRRPTARGRRPRLRP